MYRAGRAMNSLPSQILNVGCEQILTMRFIIILILSSLSSKLSFSQINVYDTANKYFSKTDFSFKDDLSNWRYKLQLKKGLFKKSKSLGHLMFYRTEAWEDLTKEFHWKWNAYIQFEIYNIKDSTLALDASQSVRKFDYCNPLETGGDYFVVGNFIFVNEVNCVQCAKENKDYCRPTVKKAFMNVNKNEISTIQEIVSQFQIQDGYKK